MPNSTQVSDGQDTLASQYNNLRTDVFDNTTGHNHDGTNSGGRKIDRSDLVDGTLAYLTASTINTHVQGAGTSGSPDSPGGEQGVHGLDAAAYVAGSGEHQLVFVAGSKSSPGTSGTCYFSDDGASPAAITLTTVYAIILTCQGSSGDSTHHKDIPEWITVNAGAGTFTYEIDHAGGSSATAMSFLVIGTK